MQRLSLVVVRALLGGFFYRFSGFPPFTNPTCPNFNLTKIENRHENQPRLMWFPTSFPGSLILPPGNEVDVVSCLNIAIYRRINGFERPFLENPEKSSHSESHNKISNLLITELLYSHVLGCPLRTRSWCKHLN